MRTRSTLFAAILIAGIAAPIMQAHAQEGGTGINYEARLGSLEEQLRAMNGRLEQLEYSTRRLEASLQRMQSDNETRLMRLENGPQQQAQQQTAVYTPPAQQPPPQMVVPPAASNMQRNSYPANEAPAQVAPVNGTLGSIKMQDGRVTDATINPQAPPLPQAPADYGLTSQEQYDRAFELLRQQNNEEAGEAFEAFIQKNPKDKMVDNAKYWYGETLYVRGKYQEAAAAFGDAFQSSPQGPKASDSLLKLALSLEGLNKISDACTTLDSLKDKYPNAPSSTRQRTDHERAKLKCGSATQ